MTRFGDFTLLEELGRSEVADRYKATHATQGGPYFLKVYSRLDAALHDELLRRCEQLIGKSHPNLARHLGHGVVDGLPFVVAPYLEGLDLGEMAKSLKDRRVTIGLESVLLVLADLATGVGALHGFAPANGVPGRNGAVARTLLGHGDVSIGHVRVGNDGQVWLTGLTTPRNDPPDRPPEARWDMAGVGALLYDLVPLLRGGGARPPLPPPLDRVVRRTLGIGPTEAQIGSPELVERLGEAGAVLKLKPDRAAFAELVRRTVRAVERRIAEEGPVRPRTPADSIPSLDPVDRIPTLEPLSGPAPVRAQNAGPGPVPMLELIPVGGPGGEHEATTRLVAQAPAPPPLAGRPPQRPATPPRGAPGGPPPLSQPPAMPPPLAPPRMPPPAALPTVSALEDLPDEAVAIVGRAEDVAPLLRPPVDEPLDLDAFGEPPALLPERATDAPTLAPAAAGDDDPFAPPPHTDSRTAPVSPRIEAPRTSPQSFADLPPDLEDEAVAPPPPPRKPPPRPAQKRLLLADPDEPGAASARPPPRPAAPARQAPPRPVSGAQPAAPGPASTAPVPSPGDLAAPPTAPKLAVPATNVAPDPARAAGATAAPPMSTATANAALEERTRDQTDPEQRSTRAAQARQDPAVRALVAQGVVAEQALKAAIDEHTLRGGRVVEILVAGGALTDATVADALAAASGRPRLSDDALRARMPPPALVRRLPQTYVLARRVLPLSLDAGHLVVALADPFDHPTLEELKNLLGADDVEALVCARAAVTAAAVEAYKSLGIGGVPHAAGGVTVLLCTADENKAARIGARLAQEGMGIEHVVDGGVAKEILQNRPPDVVICAHDLPGVNVAALLLSAREQLRTAEMPFFVYGPRGDEQLATRLLDLGADDFLTEPLKLEVLLSKVRRAARRARGEGGVNDPSMPSVQLPSIDEQTPVHAFELPPQPPLVKRTEPAFLENIAIPSLDDLPELPPDFAGEEQAPQTPPAMPTGVMGTLRQMALPEIVQSLEMGRKTARVDLVPADGDKGMIAFETGQIRYAECGALRGDDAFYQLARHKEGFFRIHYGDKPPDVNIEHQTTFLLLEAMRRMDEEDAG